MTPTASSTVPSGAQAVLIVDDDPASLALMEAVLTAEGFVTRTAAGPLSALEILKEWTPDAILVDIQLHGLDNGLEFTQRLKSNIATSDTPVIAMTAFGDRRTEAHASEAGCAAYVQKPIGARALGDVIRKCVGSGSVK